MGNYIKTHLGQSMSQAGKGLAIAVNGSGSLWSRGKVSSKDLSAVDMANAASGVFGSNITLIRSRKTNIYNTLTNTLTEGALPISGLGTRCYSFTQVADSIYLIGGTSATKLGEIYNQKTNTNTELPGSAIAVEGGNLVKVGDLLYLLNGAIFTQSPGIPLGKVYSMDLNTNTLSEVVEDLNNRSYSFYGAIAKDSEIHSVSKDLVIFDTVSKTFRVASQLNHPNNGAYCVFANKLYAINGFESLTKVASFIFEYDPNTLELTYLGTGVKGGYGTAKFISGVLYVLGTTDFNEEGTGKVTNKVFLIDLSQHLWQPLFTPQNKKANTFGPTVLEDTIVSKAAQVLKFSIEHTYPDQRELYYYELSVTPNSANIQNHQYKNDDSLESYEVSIPENTTDQSREFIVSGVFKRSDINEYEEDSKFTQKIIQLPY